MKTIVVGGGLIGSERIKALKHLQTVTANEVVLSAVVEPNLSLHAGIAENFSLAVTDSLEVALSEDPDWVFVCTPHEAAKSIILRSFENECNVLVEKPLGRSQIECKEIIDGKPDASRLAVGFNYRFYGGIEAAVHDANNGAFGNLISVNMVLGHGNAPGMENSWKLDPKICGGGCLIDPGVHMLDLVLQMAHGQVQVIGGKSWAGFWKTGIEEEAHVLMQDGAGVTFNTQVSLNRWRSTFRLEINGDRGYGVVEGRGRSYGPQSYRAGERWGWQLGKGNQAESETLIVSPYSAEDTFLKETSVLLGYDPSMVVPGAKRLLNVSSDQEALSVMCLLDDIREKLALPTSH